jgi:glycosyltransferase involved in cell wall biosynthesis
MTRERLKAALPAGSADVTHVARHAARCPRSIQGRLKLTLVVDTENWAFDNIAQNMRRHLADCCDTDVLYMKSFADFAALHRELFLGGREQHAVHFFWRPALAALLDHGVLRRATAGLTGDEVDTFFWNVAKTCKTTSVYDHLFLDNGDHAAAVRRALVIADAYSVSSPILMDLYSGLDFITPPAAVISDGVDLGLFAPRDADRVGGEGDEIRIGWAGNSAWGTPGDDHKGLRSIIVPALEQLKTEGLRVQGEFCDRMVAWRPRECMPEFYNSLDVYACASLTEGTPNPVLEAMACGLPIVSTDVGIVRSALGPLQQEFIVGNRSPREFCDKLRRLVTDPALRRRLSRENIEVIKAWDWENKADEWLSFFARAVDASANDVSRLRQRVQLAGMWSAGCTLEALAAERDAAHRELASMRRILSRRSSRLVMFLQGCLDRVLSRLSPMLRAPT